MKSLSNDATEAIVPDTTVLDAAVLDTTIPSNDKANTRTVFSKRMAPSKVNAALSELPGDLTSGLRAGKLRVSDLKCASMQLEDKEQGINKRSWRSFGASLNSELKVDNVVEKIGSGQLWVVNSRRRNGLIVLREFHAEFAGPGAAVGGSVDDDIVDVIPIGNLSLLKPESHEDHQNAIKIRLQWIRLTQNFTDQPEPDDRALMILEQFKTYFDQETVNLVSDKAFAMLVGVLPQTIRRVRSRFVW